MIALSPRVNIPSKIMTKLHQNHSQPSIASPTGGSPRIFNRKLLKHGRGTDLVCVESSVETNTGLYPNNTSLSKPNNQSQSNTFQNIREVSLEE